LPEVDPPDRTYQLVLNLSAVGADTVLMGPSVDDELAGIGSRGPHHRSRTRPGSSAELRTLREKVSLVSMQKEYWWQRYTESADECRALQDEVHELRNALTKARSGRSGSDVDQPRRAYVDRRLFS